MCIRDRKKIGRNFVLISTISKTYLSNASALKHQQIQLSTSFVTQVHNVMVLQSTSPVQKLSRHYCGQNLRWLLSGEKHFLVSSCYQSIWPVSYTHLRAHET